MRSTVKRATEFMAQSAMKEHEEKGAALPAMMMIGDRLDGITSASITGDGREDIAWLARAFSVPTGAKELAWSAEVWIGTAPPDIDLDDIKRGTLQDRVRLGDASVDTAIVASGVEIETGESHHVGYRRRLADDGSIEWDEIEMKTLDSPMTAAIIEAAREIPTTPDGDPIDANDSEWIALAFETASDLEKAEIGTSLLWTPGTLEGSLPW